MVAHPTWSFSQLASGSPEFKVLKPYIPKKMNMKHLALFMKSQFSGRLTVDRIKAIRDMWKGKIVIKGIVNEEDCQKVVDIGVDGIITDRPDLLREVLAERGLWLPR